MCIGFEWFSSNLAFLTLALQDMLYFSVRQVQDASAPVQDSNAAICDTNPFDRVVNMSKDPPRTVYKAFSKQREYNARTVSYAELNLLRIDSLVKVTE